MSAQKFTYEILNDEEPMNPRTEWDNLGTMVCFHNRYDLGDDVTKRNESPAEYRTRLAKDLDSKLNDKIDWWENAGYDIARKRFSTFEATSEYIDEKIQNLINKTLEKYILELPLYLYDHSGITISTSSFSCQWDSGQVGFIYITKEKIEQEFGWKILTKARREKIEKYLRGEVECYDKYLTGEAYGYQVLDSEGEIEDSCWGFFDRDEAEKEAIASMNSFQKDADAEKEQKAIIKRAEDTLFWSSIVKAKSQHLR